MRIEVQRTETIDLSEEVVQTVFMSHLEELTEEWYLAPSNDPQKKERLMLCRRAREIEMNTHGCEVIVAAAALLQALKEKK